MVALPPAVTDALLTRSTPAKRDPMVLLRAFGTRLHGSCSRRSGFWALDRCRRLFEEAALGKRLRCLEVTLRPLSSEAWNGAWTQATWIFAVGSAASSGRTSQPYRWRFGLLKEMRPKIRSECFGWDAQISVGTHRYVSLPPACPHHLLHPGVPRVPGGCGAAPSRWRPRHRPAPAPIGRAPVRTPHLNGRSTGSDAPHWGR
jgi:hypothetical protein